MARTRFNFGGESVNWSSQIVSTQDDEGNIYFTRDGDVQKLDATTEEASVEYKMDEILNTYDEESLTEGSKYVGVHSTQGVLFAIIETEIAEDKYDYIVVNLDTGIVSENHLNRPIGYYDTMVLDERRYNKKKEGYDYRFYDFIGDEYHNIDFLSPENEMIYLKIIKFAIDKYIVIQGYDTPIETVDGYMINPYIYFINMETYELEAKIENLYSDIMDRPYIFDFKDDLLYFFNDSFDEIKTLNIKTGDLISLYNFDRDTKYIGYDEGENCIYFKQRYNYRHGAYFTNNHIQDERTYRACFDYDVLEEAFDIYFKFNLTDGTYEVLNKVMTETQMNPNLSCITYMVDYKIGDYIFSYFDNRKSRYESNNLASNSFNFLLKLGENGMVISPRWTKK